MDDIELDYDFLTQRALKRVVYDVLSLTQELGEAPGEHHFYIEFVTRGEGVEIPDHLLAAYPERMTIVLQHQFENLEVAEDKFSVTLWFKGKQSHLVIPYDAVTSFADPSVQFGMRFSPDGPEQTASPSNGAADESASKTPPAGVDDKTDRSAEEKTSPETGADVVELDAFRKK